MDEAGRGREMPFWQRAIPLAVIVLLVIAVFATGIHREFGLDAIAMRYAWARGLVDAHPIATVLATVAVFVVFVSLSIPGAWLLTVATGLVFGWVAGSAIVTIGATLGASVLFLVARTVLADFVRKRAGPWLDAMAEGFRDNAISYLFFLRLAPVVPFTLVNLAPALLGVPYRIFAFTTFFGIMPGTIAYAFAGEGLRSLVAERAVACAEGRPPCGDPFAPSDLVTPQILIAFMLLAVVSLLPVVLKRLRRRGGL